MISAPCIVVQLIHIEGPLKNEIQEFSEPEISIGRHPSCHVRFPKDLTLISRKHARIVREGNRFKLIDQSVNGTFLNGKRVKEAFLKNGDVLIFTDGGPKVAFGTKVMEPQKNISLPPHKPETRANKKVFLDKTRGLLDIQYGPSVRRFYQLPVTIGKNPKCDFILDHPAILDLHAQIFFSRNQYWVKDLTGQNRILINGQSIQFEAPLQPDCRLSLSSQGPSFRFLSAGRLAETAELPP